MAAGGSLNPGCCRSPALSSQVEAHAGPRAAAAAVDVFAQGGRWREADALVDRMLRDGAPAKSHTVCLANCPSVR